MRLVTRFGNGCLPLRVARDGVGAWLPVKESRYFWVFAYFNQTVGFPRSHQSQSAAISSARDGSGCREHASGKEESESSFKDLYLPTAPMLGILSLTPPE